MRGEDLPVVALRAYLFQLDTVAIMPDVALPPVMVEEILFQPSLVDTLSEFAVHPGSRHLCIAGPPSCGQGAAARNLARLGNAAAPSVLKVLPAELNAGYSGEAIDRLRARWNQAAGGVLYMVELEGLFPDLNAVPLLGALRELIRTRDDVTVVLSGDAEAVAQLHALNPDLYLQFRHASVKPFTTEQLVTLVEREVLARGFELAPGFSDQALGPLAKLRAVGNLRNARISAALARGAATAASQAGRTRVTVSDLDVRSLRLGGEEAAWNGFVELDELIGLVDVKKTVRLWVANSDLAARREQLGLNVSGMGQHMVFKGPAGTAKTTVARIVGRILSETGVLSSGHLVEVQRGDLIGEMPEQTARRVIEVVKRSIGGVLFVDEAYTLTPPGSAGGAGKEAVDTLLKLMEDYREEFVVIVAGYPLEMDGFLNSNPGLRSRFVREVEFPSYSAAELLEILDFLAAKRGYRIDPEVRLALAPRLTLHSQYPGFGNGRHVRNLLEGAIVKQGTRLSTGCTDDELRILTVEDFADPVAGIKRAARPLSG